MKTARQFTSALLLCGMIGLCAQAAPEAGQQAVPAPAAGQQTFDTPEQAVESLVAAAASFELAALKGILGPKGDQLVVSEDPVMDKQRAAEFAAKAKAHKVVTIDPDDENRAYVAVGEDDYPLPIPLVKNGGKWFFDTAAGLEEVLVRRIGANELDAITICQGFFEAQHEYASVKHDGARVNQYAQRIISTPGKRDGLAWKNEDGTWDGPVGEAIAQALAQGYTAQRKPQPFHGYYFKVLKGQGPAAPLGEIDFVVGGAMIGGFALAAAPAQYKVTGVKTFMISHTGVVYEKDLGPDTLKAFEQMERYNPDETWQPTEDQWADDEDEDGEEDGDETGDGDGDDGEVDGDDDEVDGDDDGE